MVIVHATRNAAKATYQCQEKDWDNLKRKLKEPHNDTDLVLLHGTDEETILLRLGDIFDVVQIPQEEWEKRQEQQRVVQKAQARGFERLTTSEKKTFREAMGDGGEEVGIVS